ncbi:restriction endonuclease [Bacillus solimangrovi]|uniref:Uncharacterized protein n=1 Tax=Bacillus solimangrovi TaxID=1305675 RepID=A0A1E5LBX1_9BACI|nr:hypothetical protein [Bacillus solimangrovi]OEH91582.1 hypothetical protein BFG57_04200 [Bacillus solimangrovi]
MKRQNVWLVRPLPHGTNHMQDFLKKDIIAVGYPVGKELSKYTYNELRAILKKYNWEEGIGNVNILVHLMVKDDIVLVPDDNKKDVYFGKIVSDYMYDSSLDVDQAGLGFPHQRKIEWFFNKKPLLRSELPESIKGSLRYPGTVADITKHNLIIHEILHHESLPEVQTDLRDEAKQVLLELLHSNNEETRLKAAEIIMRNVPY